MDYCLKSEQRFDIHIHQDNLSAFDHVSLTLDTLMLFEGAEPEIVDAFEGPIGVVEEVQKSERVERDRMGGVAVVPGTADIFAGFENVGIVCVAAAVVAALA